MDLLRTIAVYLTIVYASSVQSTPLPEVVLGINEPLVTATAMADPTAEPTNTPIPTPSIEPNDSYSTLRVGDKGDEVTAMQEKLAEYGYLTGDVDGSYGGQTYEAVRLFQSTHGLSADGIAGKITLTVLFESDEVVSLIEPTPEPTATKAPDQISIASGEEESPTALLITNEPTVTPSPTPTPTPTPSPTPTPEPTPTATPVVVDVTVAPTEESAVVEAMEDYIIRIDGQNEAVVADPSSQDVQAYLLPYLVDGEMFVPLQAVLESAGIIVIEMQTDSLSELAFVIGDSVFRATYRSEQASTPIDLNIYENTSPLIMPIRSLIQVDDEVYFPCQTLETLMGIRFDVNETDKEVVVVMPTEEQEVQ